MGLVIYRGVTLYDGPLARVDINNGWNDSMADYYPIVGVMYAVGEEIHFKYLNVEGGFSYPVQIEVSTDVDQEDEVARIKRMHREAEEANTISLHKLVRVVRGRKVPINTEGEVFWMGDKGWGMGVGLRLLDGSKVFTAMKNVEIVRLDQVFEDLILKS